MKGDCVKAAVIIPTVQVAFVVLSFQYPKAQIITAVIHNNNNPSSSSCQFENSQPFRQNT